MTLTKKIITGIVIALGIYDLWAVSFGGMDSTISHFLQVTGFQAPVVVFVFGYIAGHIARQAAAGWRAGPTRTITAGRWKDPGTGTVVPRR